MSNLGDMDADTFFRQGDDGTYTGGPGDSIPAGVVNDFDDLDREALPRVTEEQVERRERNKRRVTGLVAVLGVSSLLGALVRTMGAGDEFSTKSEAPVNAPVAAAYAAPAAARAPEPAAAPAPEPAAAPVAPASPVAVADEPSLNRAVAPVAAEPPRVAPPEASEGAAEREGNAQRTASKVEGRSAKAVQRARASASPATPTRDVRGSSEASAGTAASLPKVTVVSVPHGAVVSAPPLGHSGPPTAYFPN